MTGRISPKEAMSGGTAATLAEGMLAPHFAFRDGRIVTERAAKRVRGFGARGKKFSAVSVGSSEHFTLPKIHPSLREVDAYLGWFGPGSKAMQGFSLLAEVPGVPAASERLARRFVKGSRGGPDEAARAKTGSLIVAEASDAGGNVIERVELDGPNGYTLTGAFLAWGAIQAAEHGVSGTGALGAKRWASRRPARRLRLPKRSEAHRGGRTCSTPAEAPSALSGPPPDGDPCFSAAESAFIGRPGKGGGPNLSDSCFGTLEVSGR
jgi:hypothetical protein